MEENKSIRDTLLRNPKNGYDRISSEEIAQINTFSEGYKVFLDRAKTEREAVNAAEVMLRAAGYTPYQRGMRLKAGDKVYSVNRGKALAAAVIGKDLFVDGALIAASHIDSPRLDLKPSPLYEDSEMALFKTHYYGGIRKYQWLTIPLELHGTVVLQSGEKVDIDLGSQPEDPVLVITDLLPHLAREQAQKPLATAYTGENLNVLVGGMPYNDEGKDRVKLAVMSILNDRYDITEEDFLSAELSLVPAGNSRDVGVDASFIGAYGQDDRVCAYATLTAMLDMEDVPARSCVCILADKEEIGSEGVSGMQSSWYDTFINNLCMSVGVMLDACYEKSVCLSADVNAAFDPNFPEAYEKRNSSLVNYGAVLNKYTGSGGKAGASDANAELVGAIRARFEECGVVWQMSELGRVDLGGGGTVAKYMAKRNIDTVDVGVPVLSMHAPFEVTAKFDDYMMYKAAKAFFGLAK